jgi:uncharacterized protein YegJ (DUF2314 family)
MILCVGSVPAGLAQERSADTELPNVDPEMAAAQSQARATLPRFWKALKNPEPGEEGFALKVAIPVGVDGTEQVWMVDIERPGSWITGVPNNLPRDATWLLPGQRTDIAENRISDWMFMRNGKIVGNFTLRPALRHMPPEEAARYRAMLEEP